MNPTFRFAHVFGELAFKVGSHIFHLFEESENEFYSGQVNAHLLSQSLNSLYALNIVFAVKAVLRAGTGWSHES